MNTLTYFFILQLGIIVTLDILVPRIPSLGVVGVTYWGLLWLTLSCFSFYTLLRIVRLVVHRRLWLTALVACLYMSLVSVSVFDSRFLSGETTREIACTLQHLTVAKDLGYSGTCHLGYPARQFYLPALPSMLFGRSLGLLQFGGIIYFLLGFTVFTHGLMLVLVRSPYSDEKGALILSGMFHFTMAMYILLTFEQAGFPISLTFYTVGLWLEWKHKPRISLILLLGLIQLTLIHAYTPALAVAVLNMLLFASLFVHSVRRRSRHWIVFLSLIIISGVSLWASTQSRSDIRLMPVSRPISISTAINAVEQIWNHVVYRDAALPWTSTVLTLPFIVVMIAAVAGLFGRSVGMLGFWMLLVMFIAVFAKGYEDGSTDYKLQRALVIVPYFLYILSEIAKRFTVSRIALMTTFLLLLITGLATIRDARSRKTETNQVRVAMHLQPYLEPDTRGNWLGTVYLSQDLRILKTDNFEDSALYFLPGWHTEEVISVDVGCRLKKGIWVLPSSHPCASENVIPHPERVVKIIGTISMDSVYGEPETISATILTVGSITKDLQDQ